MSKHTPGPWYFGPEDKPGAITFRYRISNQRRQWDQNIPNEDGTMGDYDCVNIATYEAIAITMDGTADHPAEANARLIASAPDLLACLIEMDAERTERDGADWLRHPLCVKVRTAIARAEGN